MELTARLQTLQADTMRQMHAYQMKIEETLNEREVVLAKVTNFSVLQPEIKMQMSELGFLMKQKGNLCT